MHLVSVPIRLAPVLLSNARACVEYEWGMHYSITKESAMVWSASLDILFVSVVPVMFSFETFIASDVFSVTELGGRIGRQRYTKVVEKAVLK